MSKYNLTSKRPAAELISIEEVKQHLVLDSDSQDLLLPAMIRGAREAIEAITGAYCASREFVFSFVDMPSSGIVRIPVWPVSVLTSLTYLDSDGARQPIDITGVQVISSTLPAMIFLKAVPIETNFELTFTGGYSACDLPDSLRYAMLVHMGWTFDQRGDNPDNDTMPHAIKDLAVVSSTGEEFQVYP